MTLSELISLILSMCAFVFSLISYIKGWNRQKKQDTIDAFNLLQEQVIDKLAHYTRGDIEKIAQNKRSDEYKNIAVLAARCEHFSAGVNMNIYDKKTVYRLAGNHLIYLYEKLEPLILKKREVNTKEKAYVEFEMMTESMRKDLHK